MLFRQLFLLVLAFPVGFALANLLASGLAIGFKWLGMKPAEATMLAIVLGFVAWPIWLLWVYRIRNAKALRQSMAVFHSWFGLLIGFLLFVVFWMGTLTVYDKEIDRWMHPDTRRPVAQDCCTLSESQLLTLMQMAREVAPEASNIRLRLPTPRQPLTQVRIVEPGQPMKVFWADHQTGELIQNTHTLGGSGFFFPFHYRFHLVWYDIGYYLLGVAGVAMLGLLITGVVMHRKLIAEFFVLRPNKQRLRALLDLHNLSSVVALPFHLLITFTGLLIFFSIYFPWATQAVFDGDKAASQKAISGFVGLPESGFEVGKAQQDAALPKVASMVMQRQAAWGDILGRPVQADSINLRNLGDENATVEVRRVFPQREVAMNTHADTLLIYSGELLYAHTVDPVRSFTHWINSLHFIQFDHGLLRALYFVGGLLGCVMIHTGFLFWLKARQVQHTQKGLSGFTWIQGLTVGGTLGLMIASMAFMVANQLLPKGLELRPKMETWVFYAVWLVCIAASLWNAWASRGLQAETVSYRKRQWLWPTGVFAGMAAMAFCLNQWQTGGLWTAWQQGDSNSLTVDLMLLAFSISAFSATWGMCKSARVGRAA